MEIKLSNLLLCKLYELIFWWILSFLWLLYVDDSFVLVSNSVLCVLLVLRCCFHCTSILNSPIAFSLLLLLSFSLSLSFIRRSCSDAKSFACLCIHHFHAEHGMCHTLTNTLAGRTPYAKMVCMRIAWPSCMGRIRFLLLLPCSACVCAWVCDVNVSFVCCRAVSIGVRVCKG